MRVQGCKGASVQRVKMLGWRMVLMAVCLLAFWGNGQGQVIYTVTNTYLGVSMPSDTANFTVFTTQGDPANPFDDNLALNDPVDTFWVLRFHDLPSVVGPPILAPVTVRLQGASGGAGLVTFGLNLVRPNSDTQLYARWLVFAPPFQTRPDNTIEPALFVEREITLLGDSVEIRLRLTGNDNNTRRISVGFVLDPGFNAPANPSLPTAGPFFVPSHPAINRDAEFVTDLPPFWIYTPGFAEFSLRGTVMLPEASPPRRILFALAPNLGSAFSGYGFDYRPDPFTNFSALNADSAVGMYWDAVTVGPGVSREFVVVFGLNRAFGDYRRPYSLTALSVPPLSVQLGDDPFTPEVETAFVSPNPFPVTASVYNASSEPLSGVSLTVTLPTGFTLAPGEVPTKGVATVPPNGEQQVTWQVRVDPNQVTGRAELVVTASAPVGGNRQVQVPVLVPALPVRALTAGLYMLGFPFAFTNPEPAAALGLSPAEFLLAHYDPLRQRYLIYRQDAELNRLEQGRGYWLRLLTDRPQGNPLTLQGTLPVNLDAPITVPLKQGWNQLANPFPVAILLGGLQILQGNSVVPIPFDQAVNQGLVRGTLFVWRPDPNLPPFGGEYQVLPNRYDTLLLPWQGFWLFSTIDGALLFSPPSFIGTLQTRLARQGTREKGRGTQDVLLYPTPSDGWQIRLQAESASGRDAITWLGVSRQASKGIDLLDAPKPPPVPGGLWVYSVVASGRSSVPLSMDWRPPSPQVVWLLEVVNPSGGQVRLRFDGLSQVPRSIALFLVDPETHQRWSLRSTPALTLSTQPNQPKRLQVIALQADQMTLRIQGLRTVRLRGRGAHIEFAVTQPSQVSVQVRTLTGRIVWETALMATPNTRQRVFWDGQGTFAAPLPNAMPYLVVVQAVGDDGQRAQAHALLR
ncbi:MAG: hypothetical protein YPKNTGVA_000010 [Candidatus Fervidibacter sp.]